MWSVLFVAVLAYEKVYLDNIPSAESYEQSYMHRDVISHVFVTKWGFVIYEFCHKWYYSDIHINDEHDKIEHLFHNTRVHISVDNTNSQIIHCICKN